jgi:hypothetical protein
MKYCKLDTNNEVVQVQPYIEDGFIECDDSVCCGMVKSGIGYILKEPTNIELQDKALQDAKEAKQVALDSITVTTTSGKVFDGRDIDQQRMLSAIQASSTLGIATAIWKLNDNTTVEVTLDELKEAQALAIQALGNIIVGSN